MKPLLIFSIILILSFSVISAVPFPSTPVKVGLGFQESTDSGVQVFTPEIIFDNDTLNVNHSLVADSWIGLGQLDDVNDTQHDNIAGSLTISESWLTTYINKFWCALTGCVYTGPISGPNATFENITANELFFGQPLDGGIGVGLIESDNLTADFNLNVTHDHAGAPGQISYGRGYYRGISTVTLKPFYCNISGDTVTPTSNATTIYYIDETCTVQSTSWGDFKTTTKLFYPWFLATMKHEDKIEFHYQTTLVNHLTSKDDNIYFTFESLRIEQGYSLTLEDFTNFTIAPGSYQFVRDLAQTTEQNTTAGAEVEVIVYAGGSPVFFEQDGGLNLTDCDDGTTVVACTTSALYRRTLIGIVGQQVNGDDTSEIHQVLPQQSETFSNIGNCLDTSDSPLGDSFTLPNYYRGVFISLYVYCYKPNAGDWTGEFIDIRDTQGISGSGGGGGVDTSVFLLKDGTTALTGDWNYGTFGINGSGNITTPGDITSGFINATQASFFSGFVRDGDWDCDWGVGDYCVYASEPNVLYNAHPTRNMSFYSESGFIDFLNMGFINVGSFEVDNLRLTGNTYTTTAGNIVLSSATGIGQSALAWIFTGEVNFTGGINSDDWSNVTITESQITDLTHTGNLSWNQSHANTLYAPNTTTGIQALINQTSLNLSTVTTSLHCLNPTCTSNISNNGTVTIIY